MTPPRVLLVSGEAINSVTGTGILVGNLFHAWPGDAIVQVVSAPYATRPGIRTYKLHMLSRGVGPFNAPLAGAPARPARLGGLRAAARNLLDPLPYRTPAAFLAELEAFRPELVYTGSSNIQITALATRLARYFGVPVVPHFHDDWLATKYRAPHHFLQRRRLLRAVDEMMQLCIHGIAVSSAMVEEYSRRFGVPFSVFNNCVPVPASPPPLPPEDAEGVRFVYVGGLHLNRWQGLRAVADSLARLALPAKLHIYAPAGDIARYSAELQGPALHLAGSVPAGQVPAVLARAHVLVHVESFAPHDRTYTRLSMSTKLPQYLAAGRPVLGHGPAEVASLRFLREQECGVVVGSQEQAELDAALRVLVTDAAARQRFAHNAWSTARERFEAGRVQQRFEQLLSEVARSRSARARGTARA